MKRVIISGATGAVGIALMKQLIASGVEMLVLCRAGSNRNDIIPKSPLVTKIICSLDQLKVLQNVTGKKYDVFYHFAWAGTTGEARNDASLQLLNIKYALDAVELAERFGCHMFIGAGSQAEYGRFEGELKPTTPTFPENGYGIAKLCAGQMTREYAHQLGLRHIWVRILSIYGPNDGAQTMVMSTIDKLKRGEIAKFTKGEQLWDYLYSGDAAEAFRLLGEKGIDGKTYVLGSGKARPLSEYIKIIGKSLNAEYLLEFGSIPYAEKQVMHLCADISELTNDIGWEPKEEFMQGIANIITGGGYIRLFYIRISLILFCRQKAVLYD